MWLQVHGETYNLANASRVICDDKPGTSIYIEFIIGNEAGVQRHEIGHTDRDECEKAYTYIVGMLLATNIIQQELVAQGVRDSIEELNRK